MAKYEKILPNESVDIKEFRQKGEYVCASLDEMLPWKRLSSKNWPLKNKPYFNGIHTGKSPQGKL